MKRILSLILSVVMLVSLSSPAFAADNSGNFSAESGHTKIYISSYDCPSQYIDFARNKIGEFLEASEFFGFSPCYLGNPFTFANDDSNVYYFPIFYSERIICVLRVYSNDKGNISGVLSKGFADELNAIAASTSATDPLHIYLSGSDVIFKTDSGEKTVFSYPEDQMSSVKLSSKNDVLRTSVECSSEKSTQILPASEMQRGARGTSRYLNIFASNGKPHETQGSENWCAAYVAAAILRYRGMNGLLAVDIMEYFYGNNPSTGSGLSIDQVYTYATVQGHYVSKTYSTLSYVRLCNEINYDRPVYISLRRTTSSGYAYHAVALCGYNDTSAMMRIWNPWYDYYETVSSLYNYVPSEHRNYTYEYARTIYNWA